jgi:AGCS family alanine or glycine:cation symporter
MHAQRGSLPRSVRLLAVVTLAWWLTLSGVARAQEAAESLDQRINDAVSPVTDKIVEIIFYEVPVGGGANFPLIVGWLIAGAIFFTFYFGFINIRGFRQSLRIVRGDYSDPRDPGEVSHFGALTAALSGTVGLGNIAGVAVAITLGGPGATFWMIVAGLFGMSSKFTECTLGVKYRREHPDGSVSGGPMYYLSRGIAEERGWVKVGQGLAIFFCVACALGSLGGGNMFQSNQAHQQLVAVTGGDDSFFATRGWLFGVIVAVIVGAVILGGIKSIARVTSRVVPFMGITYLLAGLIVLGANIGQVPDAFVQIFEGAFSPEGVTGGFVGVLIQGFRRATFSNEAGIGSAAIAHSAVRTREPVTEGYVALLEPFIDTVVICTMTALIIIVSGALQTDAEGVALTSEAYETVLPVVPERPRGRRDPVRLLDDARVGVLRVEGHRLPLRRQPHRGDGLQARVLRVHRHRRDDEPRRGHRVLRRDDLLRWRSATSSACTPGARGQARARGLRGEAPRGKPRRARLPGARPARRRRGARAATGRPAGSGVSRGRGAGAAAPNSAGPIIQFAMRASGPRPDAVPSLTTTASSRIVPAPASTCTHHGPETPKPTVVPMLSRTPSSVTPPVVRLRLRLVREPSSLMARPGRGGWRTASAPRGCGSRASGTRSRGGAPPCAR